MANNLKRKAVWSMIALTILAAVVPPAVMASGCRTIIRSSYVAPVVVEKQVVKAIAAVEFVTPVLPIYTVPPAYGALYVPPAAYPAPPVAAPAAAPPPAMASGTDACAETKAELQRLRQELTVLQRALRLRTPPPMPDADGRPPETAPPPEAVPKKEHGVSGGNFEAWAGPRCASCHEGASAKLKGGNFTLLADGKLATLTPQQAGEIIRRLSLPDGHESAMPKNKHLPPQERLDGVRLFVESGG